MKRAVGGPEGFLILDKPAGCTSHDVVGSVRRALRERRVGHGGTLDPDATGVLVVAVGQATRLLRFVSDLDKTYTAEVVLGTATTTLDSGGAVTATADMSGVTIEDVTSAAATLTGAIEQVPPMVSAIRVGGRRLYEIAREGETVERAPRSVTVKRFSVAPGSEPGTIAIEVDCSSGTYIRSLADDLGTALGGYAHLRNLVRTRIGAFTLDEAWRIDDVDPTMLRPPIELVGHLEGVEVDGDIAAMVAHGRVLEREVLGVDGAGPWVVRSGGQLLAIYEAHRSGTGKPLLVYRGPEGAPGGDTVDPSSVEVGHGRPDNFEAMSTEA
ncbi:MAG TPA: tRNA pseudouridine(55) synthase TruB [Acidimicrobiales bacterium]|nr:tRNA pseudouridine(55) synthase TruB [Acidimicrobiales bacterium]